MAGMSFNDGDNEDNNANSQAFLLMVVEDESDFLISNLDYV